jgi:hypothetical protein
MERNDAIAWAVATGVWLGALGLLLWLAIRERPPMTRRGLRVFIGSGVAAGLALWAVAFVGARWMERKLGLRDVRPTHAVRPSGSHPVGK